MIESTRAEQFIYAALNAAPALAGGRIYQGAAPVGASAPFVVFEMLSGVDTATLGANRVWASMLYAVKAITNGSSFSQLAPIADAIDDRLHDKTGSTADATVLACLREEPLSLSELSDAGVSYRHLGGVYRVLVQKKAA